MVRTVVKSVFSKVKDVQYGVLLNLLNNYIPLALCSYSILFKLNHFDDHFCSIFRLWMFFSLPLEKLQQSPLCFGLAIFYFGSLLAPRMFIIFFLVISV